MVRNNERREGGKEEIRDETMVRDTRERVNGIHL